MRLGLSFEKEGKDWPNREASRFVSAAGLKWHVQTMGNGPVILLLHGTGASTHSFRDLAAILCKAYTVVVPDLPGHGFTEQPEYARLSLPGMAEAVAALVEALQLKPAIVIGHSAGAAIAIQMCLDGRISPELIISINGALLPFNSVAGQFFSPLAKVLVLNPLVPLFLSARAARAGTVENLIKNTGSHLDAEGIAFYRRLFESTGHVASALGMMAKWDLYGLERRLGELKTPLVLVAGGADRAISPEQAFTVRDRVANAEVKYLPGLGHLAHEERPEAIAELVVRAAREHEAAIPL